jgi:hypothetical protein
MKPRLNWMGKFGLRREAQCHAAFARTGRVRFPTGIARSKAPSPRCSAAESKTRRFSFAPIREIRVKGFSKSVFISVHPWLNLPA